MADRKRAFRVAGICILALLAVVIIAMAAFYLDLAGHLATGSQTREPDNATAGRAIIVYNPGWTGLTGRAVENVATLLAASGYEADVAGVSSQPVQNLSGYDLVIVASPNYGKRPTALVGTFIENMQPDDGATIGVLCTNAGVTTQGADAMKARIEGRGMTVKAAMALALTEPVEPAATAFVSELLSD